jgi:hypothetical protein
VRVRERGREFIAEAIVVPKGEPVLAHIEAATADARKLDHRLREIAIVPAAHLPEEIQRVRADQPER